MDEISLLFWQSLSLPAANGLSERNCGYPQRPSPPSPVPQITLHPIFQMHRQELAHLSCCRREASRQPHPGSGCVTDGSAGGKDWGNTG